MQHGRHYRWAGRRRLRVTYSTENSLAKTKVLLGTAEIETAAARPAAADVYADVYRYREMHCARGCVLTANRSTNSVTVP